ncbi:MAG: hypothetical protein JWN50_528 [Parcubacteria group bacterium]|nr:hypothetical protein [Parcubacteria group bacterium]
MRDVTLTIGPRGAGKTTFCERALALDPELVLVSRDAVLMEIFGQTSLNPYEGGHRIGLEKMWNLVEKHLEPENARILLDCWNGWALERSELTDKLREMGAERIIGWHFATSEETCIKWFLERERRNEEEKIDKWWEQSRIASCRSDYRLFHSQAVTLEQGFDEIIRIDPDILGPEHVLRLQTNLDFG